MLKDNNYVQTLWSGIDKNEPIGIYINIPFCMCSCRYCLYKGNLNRPEDEKHSFIYDYLIPNIKSYKEILHERNITSVYFGGGTPNAVPVEDIKNICYALGDAFLQADNRIIEINPAFVDEEYIRTLCSIGFTLITFGIQSFDKESLRFQKRPYCSFEKAKQLGDICRDYGVKFSLDIMCYLKTYTAKDISIFKEDVSLAQKTGADFITCYPELNLIIKDDRARNNFIAAVSEIDLNDYYIGETILDGEPNPRSIARLIKREYSMEDYLTNILPYYENDFPYAIHNIIGFGDKQCRQEIVSYSPRRFFYTEKNVNNTPMYDIRYEREKQNG